MKSETYYLNILNNRGNILYNLHHYLKTNSGSGYIKIIKLCFSKPVFKKLINYNSFYSDEFYGTICDSIGLKYLSLNQISLFFSALCNFEKEKINGFLSLKKEFEYNVLIKNYSYACDILGEVYKKYGISLWLIDCVSILCSLSKKITSLDKLFFNEDNKFYFSLFSLKNNLSTKHNYYLKQMDGIFNELKIDISLTNYLKYILFVSIPDKEEVWKDILLFSTNYSIIDMFICLTDYLQSIYCSGKKLDSKSLICQVHLKDLNKCKINVTFDLYNENTDYNFNDKTVLDLIEAFELSKHDKVINDFYSNEFKKYDSISMYVLTAISYLFSDNIPESKSSVLYNIILELMYVILKRDETDAISAIYRLATVARILKNFDIHKGICGFLLLVANYKLGYNINEMFSTVTDIIVSQYEEKSSNYSLVPYISKRIKLDEKIIHNYIDLYENRILPNYTNKPNIYYKEGYISLLFEKLIQEDYIEEATALLVNAYIENKLLVYVIDVSAIIKNIENKYTNRTPLTIEEFCYVFIDINMKEIRDDCFLDLFDDFNGQSPLEIVKQINSSDGVKKYFLYKICNTNRLSTIYQLFLSGEEAEDCRIKICNYLLNNTDFSDRKLIMDEIEDITKRRTLSKKIKKIDESKLIINADSLKAKCNDYIAEKIDLFNNTTQCTEIKIDVYSSMVNVIDNHRIILESIYNIYCKEFCFGNSGLDISLSTRVRHGTLKNQLLKVFSDNELVFNGHGSNDYFDNYFKSNSIDKNVSIVFGDFYLNINKILDYFVKNILKVFIDTPIEGAIFNYAYDCKEYNKIFGSIINRSNKISSDEVTMLINHYIIEKTNGYLNIIRNEKLKSLEDELLKELDNLLNKIIKYHMDKKVEKDLGRKIVTCKTEIQNELKSIKNWFVLSEYNNWDSFTFEELIQTSIEIDKSLFSGFEKVNINIEQKNKIYLKGDYFREFVDVVLIIFNNAIVHSDYKDSLSDLEITCTFTEDTNNYCLSFSNNLNDSIDVIELDKIINRINNDYKSKKYLQLNVRQEGGMGLYKVMHIIFSIMQQGNSFYIYRYDNIFSIVLYFKKEISA